MTGAGDAPPSLRKLHPEQTIVRGNRSSFAYWSKVGTAEIVRSLRPGELEPLIVKADGTILRGNTRIFVLEGRGFDVNSLPGELYP